MKQWFLFRLVILGFLLDCLLKTKLPVAVVVTGSHFFFA